MLWVGTMKSHVEAALAFRQRIQHLPGILQIILFGSVARGEDTSRSDIDIAILPSKPLSLYFFLREKIYSYLIQ